MAFSAFTLASATILNGSLPSTLSISRSAGPHKAGELKRGLTATDIHGLCEGADIQIPGLRAGVDEEKGRKIIGSIMGKLFRDQDTLEVDGYIVIREERYISRDKVSEGGSFKSKIYTITSKQ